MLQVRSTSGTGNNYDSFLKFDMRAVPAFSKVKLRVFAGLSASGSVTATVYSVSKTSWSETAITWNNKPARDTALSSGKVTSKAFTWLELDVTSYLLSQRAQGKHVVSFALHSTAMSSPTVEAHSRETSTNRPQLVFTADGAPSVSLTAPLNGATFLTPATIALSATASDADGSVVKVEFFQGATLLGTARTAPFAFTWSNVASGSYTLTARATDNLGVSRRSSPVNVSVNAAPSVSLSAPLSGAIFAAPASITLNATASDPDGTVSKVEFYQGASLLATVTSPPYRFIWSNVPGGSYTLSAKATDNAGTASTSASVNVSVDVAPMISLTSPSNNSRYKAPATYALSATANDPDGSIARVEFYEGAVLVATLTQQPFSVQIAQTTAGSFTYYAKAVDDQGLITQSNSATVTVASTPAVYYIHTDQIDTPRVVTDQANKVVWRWDGADPFGASAPDEDPDGDGIRFTLNLRFPGQYFDRETGLHYNHFRDYDPGTGRYVESDPIGLGGGANTYAYTGASPMNAADFFGLYRCTYSISAHTMSCIPDDRGHPTFVSSDYLAGNDLSPDCPKKECQNNPKAENVKEHGPLPEGTYTIGPQGTFPGAVSKNARKLTPIDVPNLGDRGGFQIHGCPAGEHETCSKGCVAATTNDTRDIFNKRMDLEPNNVLTVAP